MAHQLVTLLALINVPVNEYFPIPNDRYYSGEKKAPYLTVFIGGNHEASNYLQELPYGGWVAPNIYYMGMISASIVRNMIYDHLFQMLKSHG